MKVWNKPIYDLTNKPYERVCARMRRYLKNNNNDDDNNNNITVIKEIEKVINN